MGLSERMADLLPRTKTTESCHIDASPERVFAHLTDPWVYPVWVVGATHIRGVDEGWPRPGARLHHRVGAWPFTLDDNTEVVACDAPTRLVLQARAGIFGQARVEITVEPEDGGAKVVMREAPTDGPGKVIDNPVQRLLLRLRNRESLVRLKTLVENRPAPPPPDHT